MTGETKPVLLSLKRMEEIRKAFAAGKRSIELDGVKFTLSLKKASNRYHLPKGENRTQKKEGAQFIVVRPADGSLVPTAQIERVRFNSSRTVSPG